MNRILLITSIHHLSFRSTVHLSVRVLLFLSETHIHRLTRQCTTTVDDNIKKEKIINNIIIILIISQHHYIVTMNISMNSEEDQLEQHSSIDRPRRRKLGRAARRRQSKIRAIKQSVQILLCNNNSSSLEEHQKHQQQGESDDVNCLPTDRSHSLPGVITKRRMYNGGQDGMNNDDETMLTSQLGFIPGNAISVVSRVHNIKNLYPRLYNLLTNSHHDTHCTKEQNVNSQLGEFPMVLQLYPLVTRDAYGGGKSDGRKFKSRKRGHSQVVSVENDTNNSQKQEEKHSSDAISTIEPFPTMYWLTHPHLRTLISQLEIEPTQNVKAVEKKLVSSQDQVTTMRNAHESYGRERWMLLTDEDKEETKQRKWVEALGVERGVAGIRNFETVKCLHAHAAHYLAQCSYDESSKSNTGTENIVGRWVLEAVEELILNGGRVIGQCYNE